MAEENLISLSEEEPVTPGTDAPISLSDGNKAVLSEEVVENRAQKANFGLKDASPGLDSLKAALGRGDENYARETAAASVNLRDREMKLRMIEEMARSNNGNVTPQEMDFVKGLTEQELANPKTIFESEYAKEFFNKLALSKESDNAPINKGLRENPDATLDELDAGTAILARSEVARTKLEDIKSRWEAAGTMETIGTYLEQVVPFKSWANISGAVKDAKTSAFNLPGGNLAEQVQYLWLLPPKRFEEELTKAIESIAESNLIDAQTFAQAVIAFPTSEIFTQNVFGVLDIADVGSVAGGLGRIGRQVARNAAAKTTTEQQVKKAVKDALETAGSGAKPERVLEVVGDVNTATTTKAIQKVMSEQPETVIGTADRFRGILNTVPSIARPMEVLENAGRLTNEAARRLSLKLETNAARLIDAVTDPVMAERLTPEALAVAAKNAGTELYREYKYLNDAVLDIVRNPRKVETNTDSMSIRIGTTEAKPFDDPDVAYVTARDVYGIPKEAFTVKQEGNNFFIDVERALDETKDNVRDKMVIPTNQVPKPTSAFGRMADLFLGSIRSPAETSSPLNRSNRNVVALAQEASLKFVRDVVNELGALSKKERGDFNRIITMNRDFENPATSQRGMFYKNVGELEQSYLDTFNRLPTEKETAVYFSYVQLSDYDWVLRNTTMLRDKERLGLKQYSFEFQPLQEAESAMGVSYKTQTPKFEGKEVDFVPWNSDHLSILVYDPVTKAPQIVNRNAPGETRAMVDRMFKEEGYKVVQLSNPLGRPLKEVTGSSEPIQYVITKAFEKTPLDMKQVNYAPGGHVQYKGEYWVKQPKITTGLGGARSYEGDTVAFNFTTQAQANKFTAAMEKGRQLINAKDEAGLAAHLADTLPYSPSSFKKMFADGGYYDLKQPFKTVQSGRRIIDDHADELRGSGPALKDLSKGDYNLTDEVDRKFTGERSMAGKTIVESGTDENPVFDVVDAPLIDPLSTLSRGIGQATRSRFFGDMKVAAAEQFIEEFAPVLKASREELRKYPMFYLHNPPWDEGADAAMLNQAKYTQRNAMNFIGQSTPLQKSFDWLKAKTMNRIYEKDGAEAAEIASQSAIMSSRDPTAVFRNVAFHTKLGMFNPVQWFVQAQGLAHVLAVSPTNFLPAMSGYTLSTVLRMNGSKEILEATAQKAAKLGWKADQFKEAWELMNRSGWADVGRESALIDDMSDPKIFQSSVGAFLDKGTVFFKESERMIRNAAWNASYLEFRKKNPTKTISNADIGTILSRADTLSVNMTRASKSSLEQGILSIPTQFASYQARIMDQMLGKQLTTAEKARAFGTYSMLYGVPAGIATGTGYPLYEDIKTMAIENGLDGSVLVDLFIEGIPSVITSAITGENYNIAQRYGPGGFGFVRDFLNGDKTTLEIALGASGQVVKDIIGSSSVLVSGLTEVFGEGGSYEPTIHDLIDTSRTISSVNNAFKLYAALQTGKYITKNEVYLSDMNTFDAWFSTITGLSPREVTDAFLMSRSLKGTKEMQVEAEKGFIKYYRRALQEGANGNNEAMEAYFKKSRSYLVIGDFRPDQYSDVLRRALDGQQSVAQRISERWIKQAPASKQYNRLQKSLEANEAVQKGLSN